MYIGHNVYQIRTSFQGWTNYCYIVVDNKTKAAFVVDPAWELDKIVNVLTQLNANLDSIILTHAHYDHINLVDPLVKKYNSKVFMSQKEVEYYNFKCKNLNQLNDGEVIHIEDIRVKCILTPGHTAGGMCYLLSDSIFTGDTIFTEGCGVCNLIGSSPHKMFESIQKVKALASPKICVYPAHSYGKVPGHSFEYLTKENIYLQINKEEHFVNFRMRDNQKNLLNFK